MSLRELELQVVEARAAVNRLTFAETVDETQLREARQGYAEAEAAYLEALRAETRTLPADAEGVELSTLRGRVRLGRYFDATLSHRNLDGAEGELNQYLGLGGDMVPWVALDAGPQRDVQHRADAATAGPTETEQATQSVLGRVFARSASAFLGVAMPMVPRSKANFPVLSAGAAGETTAKSMGVDAVAATLGANVLSPVRLTARYLWRREDAVVFPELEEALRTDLSGALTEALDKALMTGSGTAPQVEGFLGGGLPNPTNPTTTATYARYVASVTGEVDGRYAETAQAVRLLLGQKSYEHAHSLLHSGSGESAVTYLDRISGGVRVSVHIPAPASNIQGALLAKGPAGAAVAPIWEGVQLIRDEITGAAKGEIALTAFALYSFKILRADQFSRIEYKVA